MVCFPLRSAIAFAFRYGQKLNQHLAKICWKRYLLMLGIWLRQAPIVLGNAKGFDKRCIALFLTGLFAAIFISACAGKTNQHSPSRLAASQCDRVIEHAMGKTCVPTNPQRVVTLDTISADTTLALGIKPVGSAKPSSSYLEDRLESVRIIGIPQQPSVESILALKPDLILGFTWYHQQIYNQLSQIAPTVIFDYQSGRDTQKIIQLIGLALGKTSTAQEVIDRYYERLNQFKAVMEEQLKQTEVSVVRIQSNSFGLIQRGSFPGFILEDAGLPRPQQQQYLEPVPPGNWNHIQINIGKERIPDMDGDVLFVVNSPDYKTDERLNKLKTEPLWLQLNVVRQGRVYEVSNYWLGGGPIAIDLVIDDLFKYLIEEPNLI